MRKMFAIVVMLAYVAIAIFAIWNAESNGDQWFGTLLILLVPVGAVFMWAYNGDER